MCNSSILLISFWLISEAFKDVQDKLPESMQFFLKGSNFNPTVSAEHLDKFLKECSPRPPRTMHPKFFTGKNDMDWEGGGVLLYICYMGMCCPKGYGFGAVLVWNRVIDFAFLVWNGVWVWQGSTRHTCSFISLVILTLTRGIHLQNKLRKSTNHGEKSLDWITW